jgi:hypothetical protein
VSARPAPRQTPERAGAVRVQVLFKACEQERSTRAAAARLVDSAHEIANLPECECDVDVSVEWEPADGSAGDGRDAPVKLGGPPARGRSAER